MNEKVEKARKRFAEAGFTPEYFHQLEKDYDLQKPALLTSDERKTLDEAYFLELFEHVERQAIERLKFELNRKPGNPETWEMARRKKSEADQKNKLSRTRAIMSNLESGFDQTPKAENETNPAPEPSSADGMKQPDEAYIYKLFALAEQQ